MSDVKIEIGKIYFPSLPPNHPIRKLCEEEGFDMRVQNKVCEAWMESLQEFLEGLSTQRAEEDFVEVANARESSFCGSTIADENDALCSNEEMPPLIVGPDGGAML